VLKRLAHCPQKFTLSITEDFISVVTEICEIWIELARAWSMRLPAHGVLLIAILGFSTTYTQALQSPSLSHGSRLMVPELPVFGLSVFLACGMGRLDGEKTYPKSQ
jgi:hypothetical protein